MTCCVTKATSTNFIDGKCHIKQLISEKSHKNCLTNHTWSISHRIMPQIILMLLEVDKHTLPQKHTHVNQSYFKKSGARLV